MLYTFKQSKLRGRNKPWLRLLAGLESHCLLEQMEAQSSGFVQRFRTRPAESGSSWCCSSFDWRFASAKANVLNSQDPTWRWRCCRKRSVKWQILQYYELWIVSNSNVNVIDSQVRQSSTHASSPSCRQSHGPGDIPGTFGRRFRMLRPFRHSCCWSSLHQVS